MKYIYAIRSGDDAINFGVALDPIARLEELQEGNENPLTLVVVLRSRDADGVGHDIQVALRKDRLEGDWFKYGSSARAVVNLMFHDAAYGCGLPTIGVMMGLYECGEVGGVGRW